ncbi:MAG: hypothetical protein ABSA93_19290 [Streptosporangiaceae bacterium]|jgi:hypothetical protein
MRFREVFDMPKCACCGILVPADPVIFTHHEQSLYACSARCVRVYAEYKYPKYADEILMAEEAGENSPQRGYAPARS